VTPIDFLRTFMEKFDNSHKCRTREKNFSPVLEFYLREIRPILVNFSKVDGLNLRGSEPNHKSSLGNPKYFSTGNRMHHSEFRES